MSKTKEPSQPVGSDLFERVATILDQARNNVARSVNSNMVLAYWLIGREIVQELQDGDERVEYGKQVIESLSARLTEKYGRGYSTTNLKYFKLFYQAFSDRWDGIRHSSGDELTAVHETNVLTVVASESYRDFVSALQKDISESPSERPRIANEEYFTGKVLKTPEGDVPATPQLAKEIYRYLLKNDYTDSQDKITQACHDAKNTEQLAPLPEALQKHSQHVFALIDSVFSDAQIPDIEDDRKTKTNLLSNNFQKKEFQKLWNRINQKAAYTVHFETEELIRKCNRTLETELKVAPLQYTIQRGSQKEEATFEELKQGQAFEIHETSTATETVSVHSAVEYHLVGKLSEAVKLNRRTIATILHGLSDPTFKQYRQNPEDFIAHASRLINEQKATVIVEHLTYDMIDEKYHSDIFTREKPKENFSKALPVNRHIYEYVFIDSETERKFVRELDTSVEVFVYAKLPRSFYIPTPVGNYNSDWAIAFEEGKFKHVYFIAETKGSMSSMDLRKIEESKIECARKFFSKITSDRMKYDVVNNYGKLMELVR